MRQHCKRALSIGVGKTPIYDGKSLDLQTKNIPEGDVYRLIMKSKLPAAEKFEKYAMEEVLPTIRKLVFT